MLSNKKTKTSPLEDDDTNFTFESAQIGEEFNEDVLDYEADRDEEFQEEESTDVGLEDIGINLELAADETKMIEDDSEDTEEENKLCKTKSEQGLEYETPTEQELFAAELKTEDPAETEIKKESGQEVDEEQMKSSLIHPLVVNQSSISQQSSDGEPQEKIIFGTIDWQEIEDKLGISSSNKTMAYIDLPSQVSVFRFSFLILLSKL